MHSDFLKEHRDLRCSYDLNRSVIADMNISFTKLGPEECEKYTIFKLHDANHIKHIDENCLQCTEWSRHHEKHKEARKMNERKKEDIASTFQTFLEFNRDARKIIIWLDNCASQNKNWALFSYLVGVVNSSNIEADSIELDNLEPGHTFMSTDYFHHQVTQQVKLKGKVYDFADFEECVQRSCSGKVTVMTMQSMGFFLPFDFSSHYKIIKKTPRPYLRDMVQVVFKGGSFDMHYKKSFSEDSQELCFLKAGYLKKQILPKPQRRTTDRGVNDLKKSTILKDLLPLIPKNRQAFWLNMPTSQAPDLVTGLDD
nr:unnamed protein product [Callosobruchus analis]